MNESTSLKLDDLKDKTGLLLKDYNEAKEKIKKLGKSTLITWYRPHSIEV